MDWGNHDFSTGSFQPWLHVDPYLTSEPHAIAPAKVESSYAVAPEASVDSDPSQASQEQADLKLYQIQEAGRQSGQSSFSSTTSDVPPPAPSVLLQAESYSTDTHPSTSATPITPTTPALPISNPSLRRGMACSFCRRRKLRCTGDRPQCTNCIKYTKTCEYLPSTKAPKVKVLENRVAQLSDYIHQSGSTSRPPASNQLLPAFSSQPLLQPSHLPFPPTSYILNGIPVQNPEGLDATVYTGQDDYLDYINQDFQTPEVPPDRLFGSISQGYTGYDFNPVHTQTAFEAYSQRPTFPFGTELQTPSQPTIYASTVPSQSAPNGFPPYSQPLPPAAAPTVASSSRSPYIPEGQYGRPSWPTHLSNPDTAFSSPGSGASPSSTDELALPLSTTAKPTNHFKGHRALPTPGSLYAPVPDASVLINAAHEDPIDGLTERLGEFLFNPVEKPVVKALQPVQQSEGRKRDPVEMDRRDSSHKKRVEYDGLTDAERDILLECFLSHSRLFFEMHIPRFRHRMSFTDRRRPSLALLYAMYLWATRMSNKPAIPHREQHFFLAGCRALEVSSADGDRLIDCLRAAMLLSAFSWVSGRFHEGWILAGMAVRLVLSTGLHQIDSCVFKPAPPKDEFLRSKVYLLPPPEDSTELAERIHTFWCVYVIDRAGALATGFPTGLRDIDITTPFPRPIPDITSQLTSFTDDITVRDLYRHTFMPSTAAIYYPYELWIKAVTVLERATKLAFLEPEPGSEHAIAWQQYLVNVQLDPAAPPPPGWLEQPKYRCPQAFGEIKLGLELLMKGMGVEGLHPVERVQCDKGESAEGNDVFIAPHTIMLHHQFAATHMLLYDINSLDAENSEALAGPRRSLEMMRYLPPLPVEQVDSFCVMVWVIMAKVVVKEMHRLSLAGDIRGSQAVEVEADYFIREMKRIGSIMQLARTQAKAMDDLKERSRSVVSGDI